MLPATIGFLERNILNTLFISIGAASDIKVADKKQIPLIKAIARGIQTVRIRDKDYFEKQQIKNGLQEGIHTLSRRELENYLLADEVNWLSYVKTRISAEKIDKSLMVKRDLKKDVLKISRDEDEPDDKLKCIAAALYEHAKDILDQG